MTSYCDREEDDRKKHHLGYSTTKTLTHPQCHQKYFFPPHSLCFLNKTLTYVSIHICNGRGKLEISENPFLWILQDGYLLFYSKSDSFSSSLYCGRIEVGNKGNNSTCAFGSLITKEQINSTDVIRSTRLQ